MGEINMSDNNDEFQIPYAFFETLIDKNQKKIKIDSTEIVEIYERIKLEDTEFFNLLDDATTSDLKKIACILYVQAFVNKRELNEKSSVIKRLVETREKLRDEIKLLNSLIVSNKIIDNQRLS